jgi:lysophospholipase L1-like esterase
MNRPSPLRKIVAAVLAASLIFVTGCATRPATARHGAHHNAPKAHSPLASPPLSRPATQPLSTKPSSTQPASTQPLAKAPFAAEIEAFEQSDRTNPPPQNAVLFVGSSSIRLWKTLKQDFPDLTVINRGFGGSQVADSVRYADRIVLPYRPKAVVLYAGDNDLAAGKPPQQVLADFVAFESKVHAALPRTPVLYLAIKPSIARWNLIDKIRQANRLISDYAAQSKGKVVYVDTFTPILGLDGKPRADLLIGDGLHLNAEGYRVWTPVLRRELDEVMNRR